MDIKNNSLEDILIEKLNSSMSEFRESISDTEDDYFDCGLLDTVKFLKKAACESDADRLIVITCKAEVELKKYFDDYYDRDKSFEDLNEMFYQADSEEIERRQGWRNVVGLCSELVLNSYNYLVDLSPQFRIFETHREQFYLHDLGHKIDNYLSRQNTQYRVFLKMKKNLPCMFSGVGEDIPLKTDFDSEFEGIEKSIIKNAEKYMTNNLLLIGQS